MLHLCVLLRDKKKKIFCYRTPELFRHFNFTLLANSADILMIFSYFSETDCGISDQLSPFEDMYEMSKAVF